MSEPSASTLSEVSLKSEAESGTEMDPQRSAIGLLCILLGTLVGLVWKWSFVRFADVVCTQIPIEHGFFPDVLRSAMVARLAYLTSVTGLLVGVLLTTLILRQHRMRDWHGLRTSSIGAATLASLVLLLHQASYNDATFLTVGWCGALATWYSDRMRLDAAGDLFAKAARLSRMVISLMFLGGFVGKCTSEYWSGQVIYEIYFVDRDFWIFNWLRSHYEGAALRELAINYSRFVVVSEGLAALAWGAGWLLPSRVVALAVMGLLVGMGVLSNFNLFSVLSPLIGLAMWGWFDRRTPTRS